MQKPAQTVLLSLWKIEHACTLHRRFTNTRHICSVTFHLPSVHMLSVGAQRITRLGSRNSLHNTSVTPLSFSSHRSQLRLMPRTITLTLNSGKWLPYGFHMHLQSTSLVHEYVVLTSWHHTGWDCTGHLTSWGLWEASAWFGQVVELCVLKATVGRLKDHNLQCLVIHVISLL